MDVALIGEHKELDRDLTKRIHARALELQAVGGKPATGDRLAAFMADWAPLAQNIYTEDTPVNEC